jgi:hypothetical protein
LIQNGLSLRWTPRTGPPAKRELREVEATGEGDVSCLVLSSFAVPVAQAGWPLP